MQTQINKLEPLPEIKDYQYENLSTFEEDSYFQDQLYQQPHISSLPKLIPMVQEIWKSNQNVIEFHITHMVLNQPNTYLGYIEEDEELVIQKYDLEAYNSKDEVMKNRIQKERAMLEVTGQFKYITTYTDESLSQSHPKEYLLLARPWYN